MCQDSRRDEEKDLTAFRKGIVVTRHFTPPAIAKAYGIKPEKVIAWIKSGELPAINVATRPTGRPRFVVSETDLSTFEARRSAKPIPKSVRRERQKRSDVIEFI